MLTYDQCIAPERQTETILAVNVGAITLKRAGGAECGFLESAILLELLYGMYCYHYVRRSYPTQIDGKSHRPVINRVIMRHNDYKFRLNVVCEIFNFCSGGLQKHRAHFQNLTLHAQFCKILCHRIWEGVVFVQVSN